MQAPQARAATGGLSALIAGIMTMVCGAVAIGMTFLSWVHAGAMGFGLDISGWDTVRGLGFEEGGFSILRVGDGRIFFTGFWSILLGVLIIIAGAIMLARARAGGVVALVLGMISTAVAAVNIVMIYTRFGEGGVGSVSPGIGLWVFAVFSVAVVVTGALGMARG